MFACADCGAAFSRWEGRCPRCGAWGRLKPAGGGPRGPPGRPLALDEIDTGGTERLKTGCGELDRVLGGGMVPGSAVLIGGEPGIGKSTLLLSVGGRIDTDVLYVAGEESPAQIALRARRLRVAGRQVRVLDSTDTAEIAAVMECQQPGLCVVDSVQTLTTPDVDGAPGGPAQVRAAAEVLVPATRASGSGLFLVGQVTKVGGLAGPRFLEHAVDAVLLFEGDRHANLRALRAVKNRHGPTDEIGLFEMCTEGLKEVRNPSAFLLDGRPVAAPGSVVAAVVEGRRPMCVEVQALLDGDKRPVPRRRAQGVDPRRLEVLVAALASSYCPAVSGRDVFVNVVGGLALQDTGLDLAVAASVLGAQRPMSVEAGAVVFGEVGLRGEVRSAPQPTVRLKEARAMGFPKAFVPKGTPPIEGIRIVEVAHLTDVFEEQGRHARDPPGATTGDHDPIDQ
ncbi:MAG: DNA repair protein RadA [Planctomycetota bacterium]